MLELAKLRVQVGRRPEQQPVQTFKTNRPNQSFDERMRPWNFRNRFDFFYVQDSQICFPLMKLVQRIMVGTEILRESGHASDRLLEHPTQRLAIDSAGVYAKIR